MVEPSRRRVGVDAVGVEPGIGERIELQIETLGAIRLRHPCIADQHRRPAHPVTSAKGALGS
jgi:hypothetical protein